jgi:hypothetical protein
MNLNFSKYKANCKRHTHCNFQQEIFNEGLGLRILLKSYMKGMCVMDHGLIWKMCIQTCKMFQTSMSTCKNQLVMSILELVIVTKVIMNQQASTCKNNHQIITMPKHDFHIAFIWLHSWLGPIIYAILT